MRPTRLPIRLKFALWASALTGVVLLVYSVGTFINLYQEQLEAVDLTLASEGRALTQALGPAGTDPTAEEIDRQQPWLSFAHFDENGQLRVASTTLPESVARAALSHPAIHTVSKDGYTWRMGAWAQADQTYVVAYDLEEVHDIIADLVLSYLVSLPVVLTVAGAGGWWVSGRALAPLRAFTATAEGIQAAQLDQRMPVPAAHDEVSRLATVLNALFARLETSFAQAQRFAADASHELRTSLTVMQGDVDQLLHDAALPPSHEARLLSLQEEIGRLDRITRHLLLLAKFDAGQASSHFNPIDLTDLFRETAEDAEMLASGSGLSLVVEDEGPVTVSGDAVQLRSLLLNLWQNAARYNQPDGRITGSLGHRNGQIEIRIANTGPGIPPELRDRVFQRFFQADPSRTERRGHGLGLSLCQAIARAHGGDITLDPAPADGWTAFVVTLPGAASPPRGHALAP